jgi:hypothetical protein
MLDAGMFSVILGFGAQAAQPTTTSGSDDPFASISDFFDSGLWSAMSLLLQVFVVLLWLALVYWTYQDARRRIESPGLIAACIALSVVIPFLGTIIYLIVRPPEYLDEARERELELLALEQRLGELGDKEGKEIVGRLLAREGLPAGGDAAGVQRTLRQAGVASVQDLKDLDLRLSELEFRLRVTDRSAVPRDAGDPPARTQRARDRERERELSEPAAGDTGRVPRWRRSRRDPEAYE